MRLKIIKYNFNILINIHIKEKNSRVQNDKKER